MARALRKVSRDFNWTVKRADNDLHNVIAPRPQTRSLASPSYPDTKRVHSPLSPWDPNRLRWKFRSDYEELHEHLERAFLILISWTTSIDHLLKAAIGHYILHPICSVRRHYEENIKLAYLAIFPIFIWSLFGLLFRTVAPYIISSLCGIFSIPVNARTQAKDETDAGYAQRLTGKPVSAHLSMPVYGLQGSSGAQTPAKDDQGGATSGFPPPQPPVSLVDDFKDGIRTIHTAVRDEAKRLSRRNSGDYESHHEYAKKFAGTLATY